MPLREGVLVSDAPQGSAAWFSLRLGCLTGSRCSPVLVDESKKPSDGKRTLLFELVIEQVTGKSPKKDVTTPAMEQGLEREDAAVRRVESETGDLVSRVGFCYWVGKYAGCSPDGVIGDYDELVSIKCRDLKAHYDFIRRGVIPADARRQMAHELWITGCRKHRYVGYNPDFDRALQYRSIALTWTDLDVDAYARAAEAFLRDVQTEVDAMRTLARGFRVAAGDTP